LGFQLTLGRLILISKQNRVHAVCFVGCGGNAIPPCLAKCLVFRRAILSRLPILNQTKDTFDLEAKLVRKSVSNLIYFINGQAGKFGNSFHR
jgi:hypothetical protein